MNELRKDSILNRWVIISKDRAKRPDHFRTAPAGTTDPSKCFFCPGHESDTPEEIERWPNEGHWKIRVFPNKFKATSKETNGLLSETSSNTIMGECYGDHEILVETPDHQKSLKDIPLDQITQVLRILASREKEHYKRKHIEYVSIFKNSGKDAGASLPHSHIQLISYNLVPIIIRRKLDAIYQNHHKHGICPYCTLLHTESKTERSVTTDGRFVSFTPFASRFPFELTIIPKNHINSLSALSDSDLSDLAQTLQTVLIRLSGLGDIPYNILFFSYPKDDHFHFHIEICPRLAKWAGFELGTGTIINSMPPEDAAKFYRGENHS